jgi:hypothetical protein
VAESQDALTLPTTEDQLGEIERERLQNERIVRMLAIVIDEEITRKQVCWALQMSEGELSKRIAGAGKRPCFRILMYALKHEKTGRVARLVMEQCKYLPPKRPDDLTDAEFRSRAESLFQRSGPVGEAMRREIVGDRPVQIRKVGA